MRKSLARLFLFSTLFLVAGSAQAQREGRVYPIMRPDWETRQEWFASYRNAPRAAIEPRLNAQFLGSASLISHIQYTPSERDQSSCGNCWSWAGTGVMEVDLDVQQGIKDRLSVQFLCTCCGKTKCGCQGGWLEDVATFYQGMGYAIPWSNPNGDFQNQSGECGCTCASIGRSPSYPITSISHVVVETQGIVSNTAISNIKNILNQNKAVWFGFFFPRQTDWDSFMNFWNNQAESVIFNPPSSACGATWDDGGGGHAVLVVGYNDDDANPDNHYWLMLNSWGTTAGRPNGLMRWRMRMNYNCQSYDRSSWDYNYYWQTLNITWSVSSKPTVATSNATGVASSSATLRGMVNPKGAATTYWFDYGLSTAYGSKTPNRSAGSGSANSNVNEAVSGLSEANTYHFRLAATNSAGISYGSDRTFATSGGTPVAPDATTDAASSLGTTSAVLNATINPRGSSTACCFQYGLTTGYGLTTATQQVGSGSTPTSVSCTVIGLTTSTLYNFRAKAWSTAGTNYGANRTFSTLGTSASLLYEDFEHGGSMPPGWSQAYVQSDSWGYYINWIFCYGDGYWFEDPPAPHGGNYNAFFYDEDYYAWTGLMTPPISFGSGYAQSTLTFWHYMAEDYWWGDQDELYIFMGHTTNGPWTLLAWYTNNIIEWTKQTVNLPNPTGTVYISFDGISYWGYGIAVDDVEISVKSSSDPGPVIGQMGKSSGGKLLLRWDGSAGQQYKVDYTDNLRFGPWQEDVAAGTLQPSGGEVWYTNSPAVGTTGRCFRVRRIAP